MKRILREEMKIVKTQEDEYSTAQSYPKHLVKCTRNANFSTELPLDLDSVSVWI